MFRRVVAGCPLTFFPFQKLPHLKQSGIFNDTNLIARCSSTQPAGVLQFGGSKVTKAVPIAPIDEKMNPIDQSAEELLAQMEDFELERNARGATGCFHKILQQLNTHHSVLGHGEGSKKPLDYAHGQPTLNSAVEHLVRTYASIGNIDGSIDVINAYFNKEQKQNLDIKTLNALVDSCIKFKTYQKDSSYVLMLALMNQQNQNDVEDTIDFSDYDSKYSNTQLRNLADFAITRCFLPSHSFEQISRVLSLLDSYSSSPSQALAEISLILLKPAESAGNTGNTESWIIQKGGRSIFHPTTFGFTRLFHLLRSIEIDRFFSRGTTKLDWMLIQQFLRVSPNHGNAKFMIALLELLEVVPESKEKEDLALEIWENLSEGSGPVKRGQYLRALRSLYHNGCSEMGIVRAEWAAMCCELARATPADYLDDEEEIDEDSEDLDLSVDSSFRSTIKDDATGTEAEFDQLKEYSNLMDSSFDATEGDSEDFDQEETSETNETEMDANNKQSVNRESLFINDIQYLQTIVYDYNNHSDSRSHIQDKIFRKLTDLNDAIRIIKWLKSNGEFSDGSITVKSTSTGKNIKLKKTSYLATILASQKNESGAISNRDTNLSNNSNTTILTRPLSPELYHKMINVFTLNNCTTSAQIIANEMKNFQVYPKRHTFEKLIKAWARVGDTKKAYETLCQMRSLALNPKLEQFITVIKCANKNREAEICIELFDMVRKLKISPNNELMLEFVEALIKTDKNSNNKMAWEIVHKFIPKCVNNHKLDRSDAYTVYLSLLMWSRVGITQLLYRKFREHN